MDAYPQYAGTTDVVFNVHWVISGTDGTYVGSTYGSQAPIIDPEGTFVPYEALTPALVVEWVKDAMGPDRVTELEQIVTKQIEEQVNPPVVSPPLPWN